jgi:hypothetical protein
MSALSSALDQIHHLQLGENMNKEYSWSTNIEELIVEFHFQLTRTSDTKILEDKYQELLQKIFTQEINSIKYIKIIYKLIGYTRDIIAGKGEYNLTYMLISGLYKFYQSNNCPEIHKLKLLAMLTSVLESLIRTNPGEHPYGSWKDLKYFCNYHLEKIYNIDSTTRTWRNIKQLNDPLINKVISLICAQLKCDVNAPVKTLLAKWIPREKSNKFGWLTEALAIYYYQDWISDTLPYPKYMAAKRKCLTHFRQLVAKINKELQTPQINQCNGTWSKINFDKNVTSITLRKQGKAFKGIDKKGKMREELRNNEDRLECKKNYIEYLNRCNTGKSIAKGARVSIIDFVRDAIYAIDDTEKDCINAQWNNNAEQNSMFENMIAMVDTSVSMESENCVPLYSAMGLGIRIAEKSKFGKRVLTFSASPTWVNLDDCANFTSMVQKLRAAPWGANTNFRAALDLILNTAIQHNISPNNMKDMTLVILSDMQIDIADADNDNYFSKKSNKNDTMFEMMKEKYHDAGLRTSHQQPYELPHIVFWNLRLTNGFPSLSTSLNTSMMSGNNPNLLNKFNMQGIDSLKSCTPWINLIDELSNKRYDYLENITNVLWKNMEEELLLQSLRGRVLK